MGGTGNEGSSLGTTGLASAQLHSGTGQASGILITSCRHCYRSCELGMLSFSEFYKMIFQFLTAFLCLLMPFGTFFLGFTIFMFIGMMINILLAFASIPFLLYGWYCTYNLAIRWFLRVANWFPELKGRDW